MKIVCTIKRKLGTHTKMPDDGTVYHFLPNERGDHVAEVTNPAHIKRLLEIDVYLPYGEPAPVAEPEPEDAPLPPEVTADLTTKTLEELQAEYLHRFGRAAHPATKYDTLLRKLAEGRA